MIIIDKVKNYHITYYAQFPSIPWRYAVYSSQLPPSKFSESDHRKQKPLNVISSIAGGLGNNEYLISIQIVGLYPRYGHFWPLFHLYSQGAFIQDINPPPPPSLWETDYTKTTAFQPLIPTTLKPSLSHSNFKNDYYIQID